MEIERFLTELASPMEARSRNDRTKYHRFFAELAPRLDTARLLESELDRQLARRFNVLDYLRTDELGLSKILADLLNPRGPHGQGRSFLERFVEGLEEQVFRPNLSTGRISVTLEKAIPSGRIDVYIQLGNGDAAHCLAIENKPYAQDQQNQIKDYLKFLKGTFGERFVLIYLSPNGEGPSHSSIPKGELGKWKRRFAILPYYTVDSERHHDFQRNQPDGFEDYRLPYSLADWFKKCRRNCEVDRLRWFLRDAEVFCKRTFGGRAMTTDSETKAVEEFLRSSNRQNLKIARAVHEAWPTRRNGICETFLRKLCSRVESEVKKRIPGANDLHVDCSYVGEKKWRNCLWLYRRGWHRYKVRDSRTDGRTSIHLEAEGNGPFGWIYGVRSPLSRNDMVDRDRVRRSRLEATIGKTLGDGRNTPWWPWHKPVDERFRDWNDLVLNLHDECQETAAGGVMEYFVEKIVDTAETAIPIINEIEGVDA